MDAELPPEVLDAEKTLSNKGSGSRARRSRKRRQAWEEREQDGAHRFDGHDRRQRQDRDAHYDRRFSNPPGKRAKRRSKSGGYTETSMMGPGRGCPT